MEKQRTSATCLYRQDRTLNRAREHRQTEFSCARSHSRLQHFFSAVEAMCLPHCKGVPWLALVIWCCVGTFCQRFRAQSTSALAHTALAQSDAVCTASTCEACSTGSWNYKNLQPGMCKCAGCPSGGQMMCTSSPPNGCTCSGVRQSCSGSAPAPTPTPTPTPPPAPTCDCSKCSGYVSVSVSSPLINYMYVCTTRL